MSLPLPRDDIMSYYDGQGTLTPRQIEIVRAMMAERFPEAADRLPDLAITAGPSPERAYDAVRQLRVARTSGWTASRTARGCTRRISRSTPTAYPMGPGDALWVNESNRIWFRLRNLGTIGANGVTVKVYVDEADVFTTKCGQSISTDSATIGQANHCLPGPLEEYASYLPWTPTKIRPVRIRVAITPVPNEVTGANNGASETRHVATAVMAKADAAKELVVALETTVLNPCGVVIPVFAVPVELPLAVPPGPGPDPALPWRVDLTPRGGLRLRPETMKRTKIKLTLPATVQPGDVGEVTIALFQLTPPALAIGTARADEPPGALELIGTLGVLSHVAVRARIDCAVDARSVEVGMPIATSGVITPEHAGTPVALKYVGPSRASVIRLVTTDRTGRYSDSFVPEEPGRWSVRAFWDGDLDHAPAESKRRTFRAAARAAR